MPNIDQDAPRLSPQLQFLVACCRAEPTQEDIGLIRAYLNNQDRDTPSAITVLASRHGVLPLVYKTLKKLSETHQLPHNEDTHTLMSDAKHLYMQIAQRNMLMSAELLRIMKLLEEHGIEALAFKGPALAQLAYGDITLRQFGDLDILVDERQAHTAAEILTGHDFTAASPLEMLGNDICLEAAKDFSLFHHARKVHVELHWRLFEKKYNLPILSETDTIDVQRVCINGHDLPTLSNEHLLVYLCLHGAKHAFERFIWVCDIDRLVRSSAPDWDTCAAIAETSRVLRSFYLGLALAHRYLHTPLPAEVREHFDDRAIESLRTMIARRWSGSGKMRSEPEKNIATYVYQAKLFDRRSDLLRFYGAVIFKISTTDCQSRILPEKLKFLYLFLRPVRLVRKYGSYLAGRLPKAFK